MTPPPLPKKDMPETTFSRLLARFIARLPPVVHAPAGSAVTFDTGGDTPSAEGHLFVSLWMSLTGEYAADRTHWRETPLGCAWEVVHTHHWWRMTEAQKLVVIATVIDRLPITITMQSDVVFGDLVQGFWRVQFAGFSLTLPFGLLHRLSDSRFAASIDELFRNIPMFDKTVALIAEACLRMLRDCGPDPAVIPTHMEPAPGYMQVTVASIRLRA